MAPQVSAGQCQRVMKIGPLLVDAFQTSQLGGTHRPRVAAEGDDLQRVRTEPGAHQLVQRQRGAFHRQPPVLHHHRERRVHQKCHRRLGAGLGFGNLDVVDGDPNRTSTVLSARTTQYRVGNRAGDVPRLGVTERPRPGGPGQLAGGAGPPGLPFAVASRELLCDIAKRGLPELAHRLGRQSPLAVRAAIEKALIHQGALQIGQGAGVDGGLVAELSGQGLEVDVVHGGPGIAL